MQQIKILTKKVFTVVLLFTLCCVTIFLEPTQATRTYYEGTHIMRGDGTYLTLNKTYSYDSVQRVDGVLNFSGYNLELTAGWNLVSLPFVPTGSVFAALLDGVDYQVTAWNGTAYITPTSPTEDGAYWILVTEDVTVHLSGIPTDSYTRILPAGWSMISGVVDSNSVDTVEVFSGYSQVVSWNGTAYITVSSLRMGQGYWALVLTETPITVT